MTLFASGLFSASCPNYMLYAGNTPATTIYFYYIFLSYCVLYFTKHMSSQQYKYNQNYNESHVAAVVIGFLFGFIS